MPERSSRKSLVSWQGRSTATVYQVVNNGPVPNGLDPSPIDQGQQTSGELYFDVTGQRPIGVVYTDGINDFLVWTRHV